MDLLLPNDQVNIICDLGGVLLETNTFMAARSIGLGSMQWWVMRHWQDPRKAFMASLGSVEPFTKHEIAQYDEYGYKMPGIMCDWLKGVVPAKAILDRIKKSLHGEEFFNAFADTVFEPTVLARTQYIPHAARLFVHDCLKKGYHLYILSNWDLESFNVLRCGRFHDFFALFDGVVLSSECGILKPTNGIFDYFLKKFNIKPETCFFIDNQEENIRAARDLGIQGSTVHATMLGAPDFSGPLKIMQSWLYQKTLA